MRMKIEDSDVQLAAADLVFSYVVVYGGLLAELILIGTTDSSSSVGKWLAMLVLGVFIAFALRRISEVKWVLSESSRQQREESSTESEDGSEDEDPEITLETALKWAIVQARVEKHEEMLPQLRNMLMDVSSKDDQKCRACGTVVYNDSYGAICSECREG